MKIETFSKEAFINKYKKLFTIQKIIQLQVEILSLWFKVMEKMGSMMNFKVLAQMVEIMCENNLALIGCLKLWLVFGISKTSRILST